MTLVEFFKTAVTELQRRNVRFAVSGGMVASFYRASPRATHDVDVLLFTDSETEKTAQEIVRSLGLEPHPLRKADLEGGPMFAIKNKSTPTWIVAGRPRRGAQGIGLDLILPALPWTAKAITRAQDNPIDFGFGPVPCLTPEDLLISKFYALKNQSTRFMDMDDIKSTFESDLKLDLDYLCGELKSLALPVPAALKGTVPKSVWLAYRPRRT